MKLNDNIDIKKLTKEFKKTKHVVIDEFLDVKSANKLHNFLAHTMPENWWSTSYKLADGDVRMARRYPGMNMPDIYRQAYSDAASGRFAYVFDRTTAHAADCNCLECQYRKFLESDEVVSLLQEITGTDVSKNQELFSSRYTEGQFLSPHHDIAKGKLNLVYSLARDWKPSWGGNLYLLKDDWKTIDKVLLSSFNRLAITLMNDEETVGVPHFVSQVADGVRYPRISITSWMS